MQGRGGLRRRRLVVVSAVVSLLAGGCAATTAARRIPLSGLPAVPAVVGQWDWPTYGHDAQHTFHGQTTLTPATVGSLRRAWYFPTGDAVTATPTVVGGTVYVGSWDDYFYALDLETGRPRWKVRLKSQNGVTPYPGEKPRDGSSDGGLVTSSAWFQPAGAGHPPLVIFGGGYTLYALDATDGQVVWEHDYPGLVGRPDPAHDATRIFSSPVVADGLVLFATDEDGQEGSSGMVVGASLDSGAPVWEFQTDVASAGGPVLHDSCGSVWSSGTVLPQQDLVVFGTSDCKSSGKPIYADSILALHIATGTLAWSDHPDGDAPVCDFDIGASANAGVDASGTTTFLGEGSKDGTYYSLDPATGKARWATNVVFGGSSGGFLATTAYDGQAVYGSTGIGDFNPSRHGNVVCDPSNPRDKGAEEPTTHAFDARTGKVLWQADATSSFAPTTVAGGMTFNGLGFADKVVEVRQASTGRVLARVALPQANWSGIATVGDALVLGLGTDFSPTSSGVEVLTPGGSPPVVPQSN